MILIKKQIQALTQIIGTLANLVKDVSSLMRDVRYTMNQYDQRLTNLESLKDPLYNNEQLGKRIRDYYEKRISTLESIVGVIAHYLPLTVEYDGEGKIVWVSEPPSTTIFNETNSKQAGIIPAMSARAQGFPQNPENGDMFIKGQYVYEYNLFNDAWLSIDNVIVNPTENDIATGGRVHPLEGKWVLIPNKTTPPPDPSWAVVRVEQNHSVKQITLIPETYRGMRTISRIEAWIIGFPMPALYAEPEFFFMDHKYKFNKNTQLWEIQEGVKKYQPGILPTQIKHPDESLNLGFPQRPLDGYYYTYKGMSYKFNKTTQSWEIQL